MLLFSRVLLKSPYPLSANEYHCFAIKIALSNFAAQACGRIFNAVVSAPSTLKNLTLADCNRS